MRKPITEQLQSKIQLTGFVAVTVMYLCLFNFFFSAKHLNLPGMQILLAAMLASGLIVFLVPFIEMYYGIQKGWKFGKLVFILVGLCGITEAVVSFYTLYTGDRYWYDIFNIRGGLTLFLGLGFAGVITSQLYGGAKIAR